MLSNRISLDKKVLFCCPQNFFRDLKSQWFRQSCFLLKNCGIDCIFPKHLRQSQAHVPCTLIQGYLHPLCYSILLKCCMNSLHNHNPIINTIIIPYTLQLEIRLNLNHGLPSIENRKHFILVLHEVNPQISCEIINKDHIVVQTSQRCNMDGSPHINVHLLQHLRFVSLPLLN